MRWLDQFKSTLGIASPALNPEEVPPHSPARALARSLTDPDTRGEWERKLECVLQGLRWTYRNEARNITLIRAMRVGFGFSSDTISTPFKLNKAEEQIVCDALMAFNAHWRETSEKEAYARLTEPAQAMDALWAKTAKQAEGKARQRGSSKRNAPNG